MNIRMNVFITTISSLIIGAVISIVVVSNILVAYIESGENNSIKEDYRNTSMIFDSEKRNLERSESDWSNWDDAYQFLNDKNNDFIKENLGIDTLKQLNLYGMIFTDKRLNLVHSDVINNKKNKMILKYISDKVKSKSFFQNLKKNKIYSGLTIIENKKFLLVASGVTTTDGKANVNGYLIMIRRIDSSFDKYMEKLLNVSVTIKTSSASNNAISYDRFNKIDIQRYGTIIKSSSQIKDMLDNKSIIISAEKKRDSYKKAIQAFKVGGCILFVIFAVMIVTCLVSINNAVIKRVLKLSSFVDHVMRTNDMSTRIHISGNNEITRLSNNINNMLSELNRNYIDAKKNDELLNLIMEATNDGYFDYNSKTKEVIISPVWLKCLGFTSETTSLNYKKCLESILEEDRIKLRDKAHRCLIGETENFAAEIRVYTVNAGYIWASIRGKIVIRDENGKPLRWIGTICDITLRKSDEQQNIYLLQTDTVTNLKNRAYVDDLLKNIERKNEGSFSFIMADVNGLKLTNDTFGHKEGDKLLSAIGNVLMVCCSETDIPVRWGGDEFLIIVNNNRKYAESLIRKIKLKCEEVSSLPIKLNISMGCASKRASDVSVDQTLKRAEERMYRNKLLEGKSVRNAIISSLEQSLDEKKIETHEHTERVKKICLRLGQKLGFTQDELDEIALLSILHDIGKIAVPNNILTNAEKLTESERKIVEDHTETGYRITKAVPELAHIADKVLSHHERYDGKGYPRGLTGDDIPKISRVLAVAHDFDGLIYKDDSNQTIDYEQAIKEIEKYSGSKYDPKIVKAFLEIYKTNM